MLERIKNLRRCVMNVPNDPYVRNAEAHRILFLDGLADRPLTNELDKACVTEAVRQFEMDVGWCPSPRALFWLRTIAEKTV